MSMKTRFRCEELWQKKGPHAEHWTALQVRDLLIKDREDIWNNYEKIGFVRHPYTWTVSMYHLRETLNMMKEDNTKPFPEFIQNLKMKIYDWFVDENGKCLLDTICKTEDLRAFFAKYGASYKHINGTHPNKPKITMSEDDKDIIDQKFNRELLHYSPQKRKNRGTDPMPIITRQPMQYKDGERIPATRALTPEEIEQASIKEPEIVEIVKHKVGQITVKKSDDNTYTRIGGSLAWRYNNVGNIKYGKFAKSCYGCIGPGWGNHAVFATLKDSTEAQRKLLFTPIRRYASKSIINALKKYAPYSDNNNPKRYAIYVANHVGVSINTKLKDMTKDQQNRMMDAMKIYEGFKEGLETID